ncbi:MAG: arsenate reductase ArsC [Phycisphaeraceae bacterium]|nr:arsenate reductase ArsC [Phycisphaeraceae bacterium]
MNQNKKKRILFICTGNACRSQMAEAWAAKLKPHAIEAYSAGSHPAGFVSKRVIKAMQEAGIDMSSAWSKPIDQWQDIEFDYVITLCDYAKEFCPDFALPTRMVHRDFPDPMAIMGNDQMTMHAFKRARDMVKEYVMTLPEALEK